MSDEPFGVAIQEPIKGYAMIYRPGEDGAEEGAIGSLLASASGIGFKIAV